MKNKFEFDINFVHDRKNNKPIINIIIEANINGSSYKANSFAYTYEIAAMDKDHFPWKENKIKDMLMNMIESSIDNGNYYL